MKKARVQGGDAPAGHTTHTAVSLSAFAAVSIALLSFSFSALSLSRNIPPLSLCLTFSTFLLCLSIASLSRTQHRPRASNAVSGHKRSKRKRCVGGSATHTHTRCTRRGTGVPSPRSPRALSCKGRENEGHGRGQRARGAPGGREVSRVCFGEVSPLACLLSPGRQERRRSGRSEPSADVRLPLV